MRSRTSAMRARSRSFAAAAPTAAAGAARRGGGGGVGGGGPAVWRVLGEAGRDVLVVDAKPEDEDKDLGDPDVLVDALFGTGFEGEPRPGAARLIERMNDLGAPVLSVDLPSGVDASTGEVAGAAVD